MDVQRTKVIFKTETKTLYQISKKKQTPSRETYKNYKNIFENIKNQSKNNYYSSLS